MSRFKGGAATCPIDDGSWPAWPLPLHAAAGPDASTVTAGSSVPCPEPTPGGVTDPRGSVGKTPLTDLVDACCQVTGVDWQHQLYSTLSNSRSRVQGSFSAPMCTLCAPRPTSRTCLR
jgi:hypothetical protein